MDNDIPLTLRELQHPFSLGKDQLTILSSFVEKRANEGAAREFTGSLLFGDRTNIAELGKQQGRWEAGTFTKVQDPQLEIADALSLVREAVARLARLASERGEGENRGIRDFVIDYATFLRRSCVYRPCNLILDRVLKTVFTDECFPYANGEFLQDSITSPRWQKCEDAAEL